MQPTDYVIAGDFPSRSFRLRVNDEPITVVETPPMTAVERLALAAEYRKLPDYCHIYDPAGMHLHYAHLAVAGPAAINIEIDEPIRSFRVHPFRRKIAARADGCVLTFATGEDEPRHFIVRLNDLPPLMLALELPETAPPMAGDAGVIDGASFLTDPGGTGDQTDAFHRAFAAANDSGKTLLVPPGTYAVSQLHLRGGRNFRLHLAPGSLIQVRPSARGENAHRHGLWLEDCEDVAITGAGCIDHQAYEHYVLGPNNYQDGMVDYYTANELCPWTTQSPLFLTGSRRITVDGLVIRNGRNFNVNCRHCDDLTLRRLKIFTPAACTPEYADGINTGSCQGVRIENCLVASNDDCFASGHYLSTYDRRPAARHVIRGLLGWSLRGSGARLGFFSSHDQGDFTFENCDFVGMPYSTLLIHPLRAPAAGPVARYGTIRLADSAFDDAARLDSLLDAQRPAIQALELVNVAFHGPPRPGATFVIEGDPAAPIGRVRFEHVTVDGRPLADLPGATAKIGGVPELNVR
ncbi:MAG: glycosyl hydrolase family 28 protein [Opitutales bacterium]